MFTSSTRCLNFIPSNTYIALASLISEKLTTHFPPYLSHVEVQNLSTSETSVCLCRLP
ncbi:unnamed protein product, partial [Vitis vinifera]|uniref:Uncharacterized protein n=1 Tax=Vitis vinifera TaxID=29760 RepID=D7ST43_VITVI